MAVTIEGLAMVVVVSFVGVAGEVRTRERTVLVSV